MKLIYFNYWFKLRWWHEWGVTCIFRWYMATGLSTPFPLNNIFFNLLTSNCRLTTVSSYFPIRMTAADSWSSSSFSRANLRSKLTMRSIKTAFEIIPSIVLKISKTNGFTQLSDIFFFVLWKKFRCLPRASPSQTRLIPQKCFYPIPPLQKYASRIPCTRWQSRYCPTWAAWFYPSVY